MAFNENLDVFLADFGIPVVFRGTEYVGILDLPDELIEGVVISAQYSVVVKVSDFPSVDRNEAIRVDEVDYLVREYKKFDDGKFAIIALKKT